MSFITVINIFLDAQRFQSQDTTDTQQDFLFQTVFPVAAIKLVSDRTVEFAVHFIIRIKQIQRNTSNIHTPYVCMNKIIKIRNVNYQRLTIGIHYAFNRKLTEVLCLVVGNLLSIHRQRLSKVAVTIQETYRTQINIAVGSLFQIVTSQYAQTAPKKVPIVIRANPIQSDISFTILNSRTRSLSITLFFSPLTLIIPI